MLVLPVVKRRWLLDEAPGHRVRVEIKRRIGFSERDQPLHQVVTDSGPLRAEGRDGKAARLALVDRSLHLVAEFVSPDECRVRIDLRDMSSIIRWSFATVVIAPTSVLQHLEQRHPSQPLGAVGGDLPPVVALADLSLAEPLPTAVGHDQRRVDQEQRIGTGHLVDPGHGLVEAAGPAGLDHGPGEVGGHDPGLVGKSVCGGLSPCQIDPDDTHRPSVTRARVSRWPAGGSPDAGHEVTFDTISGMSSACPVTDDTKQLGEYVRRAREHSGVTQYQLAERLGCQQPAISRLESGGVSPNLSTLHRIAKALGFQLEIQMVPRDEVFTTGQPFQFTSAPSGDPSFRPW